MTSNRLTRVLALFSGMDIPLLATTVAMCVLGIATIAGIGGLNGPYVLRHSILVGVSLLAMLVFSHFNYRYLKNYSVPVLIFYGICVLLLVATLFTPAIRGARAWIQFGGFTFEPSELMKLALIIVMAKYFSQRHILINQFKHIAVSGFYLALPLGIIFLQPDLGSASTLMVIWGGMLLASGINKRHLFMLLSMGVIVSYLSWIFVLKEYQKDRLIAFINPYQDPTGIGYNIIQSKIAIGSGHWFGTGWNNGSQTTLGFLPEPYNDFVFASLAEQFGFVGILVLVALLVFLLLRILRIGREAENNFAKLFSIGMMLFILTHAIVSACVNIGIMPITGIPFPFLSYGGSHLLSLMIGLGLLHSINRYG